VIIIPRQLPTQLSRLKSHRTQQTILILWHTKKADSLVGAAEMTRAALNSGKALNRIAPVITTDVINPPIQCSFSLCFHNTMGDNNLLEKIAKTLQYSNTKSNNRLIKYQSITELTEILLKVALNTKTP
jgi:hypothetical protein